MDELNLCKPDGSVKSKEEFIKDADQFYDDIIEEIKADHEPPSLMELVTCPENQTDVANALENFDYYERKIYITAEILQEDAANIHQLISFYNRMDNLESVPIEKRRPIKIYIDSPGGELDAGFSIISSIKTSKTPVYTYNIGRAWSCAFFILITGHKRFGVPYSSYLFHEGACGNIQDAHKYIAHTNFYIHQLKMLKNIVLENTEINEEEYDSHIKDDWWLSVDEAYLYNVIDEIINDITQEEE